MPLYTLWETGSAGEIVFAAVHCTGGDVLIALSALMLALFLAGSPGWPAVRNRRVTVLTVAFGLGYKVFSEWLNIEVRQAWAYRDLMPIILVIAAERAGVGVETVRFYERRGLIEQPPKPRDGGYRSYDERTVERIRGSARARF